MEAVARQAKNWCRFSFSFTGTSVTMVDGVITAVAAGSPIDLTDAVVVLVMQSPDSPPTVSEVPAEIVGDPVAGAVQCLCKVIDAPGEWQLQFRATLPGGEPLYGIPFNYEAGKNL